VEKEVDKYLEDTLVYKDGKFFYGGRELPDEDKNTILAEAEQLQVMLLPKILMNGLKQASFEMLLKSSNSDEVAIGKACYFVAKNYEEQLEKFKNIK
jgi:hypothetical protein